MNKKLKTAIQIGIAIIAVTFIIYGINREENETVLNKAVNICFECIGLG